MIDLQYVDQGLDLGVELHVSIVGRTAERQYDAYVVAAHKRRAPEKLVSSEPVVARSNPQQTPNLAAQEVLKILREMPAPPNAADVIAEKDAELARVRAELDAIKSAEASKGKKKGDKPE